MSLKILIVVLLILIAPSVRGLTMVQLESDVRGRSIAFDEKRIPDSVIRAFANDAQKLIAQLGKVIQKRTTIAVNNTAFEYGLPSDFYDVEVVVLQPATPSVPGAVNKNGLSLQYVPMKEFGRGNAPDNDKPSMYSIWDDTLHLNRRSASSEFDTVRVFYYADPRFLTGDTSTIDLPVHAEELLKEYIVAMCFDRLEMEPPNRERTVALIAELETRLYGRPRDEKK